MNPDTTTTPEGWEKRGPCFIREHNGHFSVMDQSVDGKGWRVLVNYRSGGRDASGWKPLCEAIDWAHAKLGVPKPVVKIVCKDAILLHTADMQRSERFVPGGVYSEDALEAVMNRLRGGE